MLFAGRGNADNNYLDGLTFPFEFEGNQPGRDADLWIYIDEPASPSTTTVVSNAQFTATAGQGKRIRNESSSSQVRVFVAQI